MTRRSSTHRGFIAITVLIGLAVLGSVAAALVTRIAADRKADRTAALLTQAELLAQSGIERAKVKLRQDPSYRGETWEIPKDQVAGGAVVTIKSEPGPNGKVKFNSSSEYPRSALHSARAALGIVLSPPSGETNK